MWEFEPRARSKMNTMNVLLRSTIPPRADGVNALLKRDTRRRKSARGKHHKVQYSVFVGGECLENIEAGLRGTRIYPCVF